MHLCYNFLGFCLWMNVWDHNQIRLSAGRVRFSIDFVANSRWLCSSPFIACPIYSVFLGFSFKEEEDCIHFVLDFIWVLLILVESNTLLCHWDLDVVYASGFSYRDRKVETYFYGIMRGKMGNCGSSMAVASGGSLCGFEFCIVVSKFVLEPCMIAVFSGIGLVWALKWIRI